ncbi:hypothetical protein F2Q68_00040407 [Brassica cretica]|uniref:Replication protein A 70 kDa DNA-binding subunit B/D first OB fold domain-containing protein n=1 Tax=Brassica cretica TaxID=69181 RepID=A0A8S9MPU3_BRACR|nr:hypothetical protein F2Q68_00040407 [Brassica cretica]
MKYFSPTLTGVPLISAVPWAQTAADKRRVMRKEGVKIHASCKQTLMPKLENYFRVGEWKVITNFTLSPASGLNRPTNHRYKMKFVSQTSISDSNLQCHNMFLDLHDFANVLNGSQDPSFLIDVVGEVLDLGGLDIVQFARKEVTRLEFTLRDIKDQRLHCCITGGLADKLTQEGNMPNNGDICLIRFAKLCNYKGKLQVSNAFDSSLLLLNPDISEAQALNQMFHGDDNSLDVYQPKKTRQKWSQYPFRAIQEMKHTDKCSVRKAAPRYKLALLVQDLTGESNFNLLDSAATFIVKISAAKVVNQWFDEIGNQEMLPPEIVDIVGKTYGFGISFDESNRSCGTQFSAKKVWNLTDIMWKRIKSLHQISTSSRKKQFLNVDEVENKDHGEAKENKSC